MGDKSWDEVKRERAARTDEDLVGVTPGPWEAIWDDDLNRYTIYGDADDSFVDVAVIHEDHPKNAHFIANARSEVVRLRARVRELERDLARVEASDADAVMRATAATTRALEAEAKVEELQHGRNHPYGGIEGCDRCAAPARTGEGDCPAAPGALCCGNVAACRDAMKGEA
jgi:uncharacterized membrane protein